MRAIFLRLGHCWSRTRAALWPFNARAKTFVVRIEVKEKLVGVSLVSGLKFLQDSFKEPRSVTDVPARRRHELRSLNHVVFDLQRRDDLQRACAHLLIEIGERGRRTYMTLSNR